MSDKEVEIPVEVAVVESEDIVVKIQGFFEKFGKTIAILVGGVVVVIAGIFAYNQFVLKPKEEKAAEVIYKAQKYFSVDSSKKVLEGDETSKGVLYVISNYGGTKAANLAKYYAGVSYLKLGEFPKAIEYLKDFKTDAKQVQMVAYGCLADAYAESGNKETAIEYYVKAGSYFEKDESNSAEYLFRAALLNETTGKEEKALELYKEIKEKFPKTEKGSQVDKYINRLSNEQPTF
jgi:tetratricopeptide (TPR) repeat protein